MEDLSLPVGGPVGLCGVAALDHVQVGLRALRIDRELIILEPVADRVEEYLHVIIGPHGGIVLMPGGLERQLIHLRLTAADAEVQVRVIVEHPEVGLDLLGDRRPVCLSERVLEAGMVGRLLPCRLIKLAIERDGALEADGRDGPLRRHEFGSMGADDCECEDDCRPVPAHVLLLCSGAVAESQRCARDTSWPERAAIPAGG